MIKNLIISILSVFILILLFVLREKHACKNELFSLKKNGVLNLTRYNCSSENLDAGVKSNVSYWAQMMKKEDKNFDQIIYISNELKNDMFFKNSNAIVIALKYDSCYRYTNCN